MNRMPKASLQIGTLILATVLLSTLVASASEGEKPVKRDYAVTPPAPANQTVADADAKSAGCMSCHTETDSKSMHVSPAVQLGCTDCHGGDAGVNVSAGASHGSMEYEAATELAHVLPLYPESWHLPHSANPERTYTLLNRESRDSFYEPIGLPGRE